MRWKDTAKKYAKKILKYNRTYQRYKVCRVIKYADPNFHKLRCIYRTHGNSKLDQLRQMTETVRIQPEPQMRFQHWLDEDLAVCNLNKVVGNMPPDYQKVIDFSLAELMEENQCAGKVAAENRVLLQIVDAYIDRILREFRCLPQTKEMNKAIVSFENMKSKKADSMEEALQRILFWSSLFWQSGHRLVGLGRLDKVLERFAGTADTGKVLAVIKDFLLRLHEHYGYKSSSLLGDIGQIIILGGKEADGGYYCNELTFLFLEAVRQLHITDPKLLLRVGEKMPEDLLESAVDCIATGVGSPLLSNDEVVIPALLEFGYSEKDAYNYVTSACWEPVSFGNSLEQNNLMHINFADAFDQAMRDSSAKKIHTYEEFLLFYEKKLRLQLQDILKKLSEMKWEESPLFTFFTDGCLKDGKGITEGGAVYSDYGILSVGMGNAVNSLLNLKSLVFQKDGSAWQEILGLWQKKRLEDKDRKILSDRLKSQRKQFGHDEEESIQLTNRLMEVVSLGISGYRNLLGGKVKYGLSSPAYITVGKNTGLTFDGRNEKDALMVHISAEDGTAYTELVSFASQLLYTGWSANANVVDYFVSPGFLQDNRKKFIAFLKAGIRQGFFQMQMNVVSSDRLIAAQKDPDKFPDLIVRVWGFSAYFKDLPKEYQDVLIHRALVSEGKAA